LIKKNLVFVRKNFVDFLKHSRELKNLVSSLGVLDFFSNVNLSQLLGSCVYIFYCRKVCGYYVGETSTKGERIGDDLKALEQKNHVNPRLQKDWNTYGSNSFIVLTVFENGK